VPVTRTLICSPIRLYCEGLGTLLDEDPDLAVVGVAMATRDWVRQAEALRPQLILVDLAVPAGAETLGAIAELTPIARTVALSVAQDEGTVIRLVRAGVTAFVSREATLDDLRAALREAISGQSPGPGWLMPMLLQRVAQGGNGADDPERPGLKRLTRREREVLSRVADGRSNKQIAGDLQIELPTVKNHMHNILRKLDVSCRSEAVAYALNRTV
jgi:two-component system nitrate/nitrite response regulator NarL